MNPLAPACRTALDGDDWPRFVFLVICIVYAVIATYLTMEAVRNGRPDMSASARWWHVTKVVFFTYLINLPLVATTAWEGRDMAEWINPHRQAPALLFGDWMVVPLLMVLCALIWQRLPTDVGWLRSPWLLLVPMSLGWVAAVAFRIHEAGAYDPLRFWSAGKLAHDFVSTPGIAALLAFAIAMMFAGLRYLRRPQPTTNRPSRGLPWLVLGVFVALMGFAWLIWLGFIGLDATWLHQPGDWHHAGRALVCATSQSGS